MAEAPRVAFQGGRMRFFDGKGCTYTIYDVARVGGRIRKTAYAAEMATWRVFVEPDGRRHPYRFRRGEVRDLDPKILAEQLTVAVWANIFIPDRKSRR